MNDYCEYCDNEIEHNIDSDKQRFCRDECRVNFHNAQRKILRKHQAVERATKDLFRMLEDDSMSGMHSTIVNTLLNAQFNMTESFATGRIERICPNCKLTTTHDNLLCNDCQTRTVYNRLIPNS